MSTNRRSSATEWAVPAEDGTAICFRPSGPAWSYTVLDAAPGPGRPATRRELASEQGAPEDKMREVLASAMTAGEFRAAALRAGARAASDELHPRVPLAMVTGELPDGRTFALSPAPATDCPEPGQPMPVLTLLGIFPAGDPFGDPDAIIADCRAAAALDIIARLAGRRSPGTGPAVPAPPPAAAGGTPGPDPGLALETLASSSGPQEQGDLLYRVRISGGQSVIGFRAVFDTVGIAFEHGRPGSRGLSRPALSGTETVFRAIYPNKGSAPTARPARRSA